MPFEIVRNDITKMKVDAIVNAANPSLLGGGGVDGAVHRAAGEELLAECRTLGGCAPGQARITKGYRLPAKYVIHTVGPVWSGGKNRERELLTSCYEQSLKLALEYHCESIAFPMISTGAYGYPKDEAMEVAVEAVSHFLLSHEMMVYLVVFGKESLLAGQKLFRDIQSYIDDTYVDEHFDRYRESFRARNRILQAPFGSLRDAMPAAAAPMAAESEQEWGAPGEAPDWDEMLKKTDEGFSQTLLRLIDERGLTDAQCYKGANVDRKLFSKIRSNPEYRPSKPTTLAFAVSLKLNLQETKSLLEKAGFALSHSSRFDIILEYFILHQDYDIYRINEVLFEYDLPLLGNSSNVAS